MTILSQPSLGAIERNDTLTERVVAKLRKALMDGAFIPGQQIKIRDIAKAMNVSPTPAREALAILIAEGVLLTADTNKSAMVPALTADNLREITELRVALECVAAAAAFVNITDQDIARLEKIQEEVVTATTQDDVKATLESNSAFHMALYELSRKPLIIKMLETVWLRSGAYLRTAYPVYGRLRKGLNNHDEIITSLKKRDLDALRIAIEKDIRDSSNHLFSELEPHFAKA
jgi:DNA-binding GntR family transcriptional regulator